MLIKYRFSINGHSVTPSYKDGITKDYKLEPQQRFYRADLSGSLKFMRDDYEWILAQDFEDELILLIEKSNDGGLTWSNYYTGAFYQTDCQVDQDTKKIEVKVDTRDQYVNVLAGLENEYNLIKLSPAKTAVTIQKRPLIQLYIPGDEVISCFLSGNYWEQSVTEAVTDTGVLVSTHHFALASTLQKMLMSGSAIADLTGDFVGENSAAMYGPSATYKVLFETNQHVYIVGNSEDYGKTSADYGSIWKDRSNNMWILTGVSTTQLTFTSFFHGSGMLSPGEGYDYLTHVKGATNTGTVSYGVVTIPESGATVGLFSLRKSSDNVIHFFCPTSYESRPTGTISFKPYQGTGTLSGYQYITPVYMRYLLDVEKISGLNTYPLAATDIVDDNRNYKRAIGYAIDCVSISNYLSTTPTEYGIADNGKYFQMPYTLWGAKFYPVARSTWGLSSVWFAFETFDWILEEQGRKSYTMKDSTLISDAIKVLLNEIDPTITHDGTSEYSQFLYGTTNPITYNMFRLMITQKSNILAGEYDQPAQKAPITLSAIMVMLRDCFKCFWYIEDNKFKIEHISWFKNGGTYSGSPAISYDLTTLIQRKNGKPWGFLSSNYSYDKVDMAERYEFAWMDDVTEGFEGYPIEINSKYVQRGKLENVNISTFTTDIDYMLLNPSAITHDGFALMAVVPTPNLFNRNDYDISEGYYLNTGTGGLIAHSNYGTTGYISVKANTNYALGPWEFMVWYDSNKTRISGTNIAVTPSYVHKSPANAAYVRYSLSGISTWKDKFKIVEGTDLNAWVLPYIQRDIDGAELRLQNGILSWIYLHPNYWVWDLPARNVTINKDSYTWVQGIERKKKQKISFPSIDDPNPLQIIKTPMGDGQIEKLSINLQSRMNDIELKYDTE
jgi:hypothetical protein